VTPTTMRTISSSARPDWRTPEALLERIRQAFGPVALDPCGGPGSLVDARLELSLEAGDDGLSADWRALAGGGLNSGLVFVNPPYGRQIGPWVAKCREEGDRDANVLALLPARTDARWWQENVTAGCACVLFLRGRLTFLGAPAPAPFPSALVYWGPWMAFSRHSPLPHLADLGQFWNLT